MLGPLDAVSGALYGLPARAAKVSARLTPVSSRLDGMLVGVAAVACRLDAMLGLAAVVPGRLGVSAASRSWPRQRIAGPPRTLVERGTRVAVESDPSAYDRTGVEIDNIEFLVSGLRPAVRPECLGALCCRFSCSCDHRQRVETQVDRADAGLGRINDHTV